MKEERDRRHLTPEGRLVAGLRHYVNHPEALPRYVAGSHPDWNDRDDHCYSFLFRVAIAQELLPDRQARALMAKIRPGEPDSFRRALFPAGYTRLPLQVRGDRVQIPSGAIPAGQLVSLDGGAHVMVSTGRLLPGGRHEVFSFKGGGPETPVWGDSVGLDDHPRLHVLALEDELEALLRDDQPLDEVVIAVGPSALTPAD
ncbi:MAG: hypothetical protein VKP62_13960 [Candidatus Sericytochromatia bacterium]|nr:hypothetical protein [Candidatus Sericytochromatia bacterium]